MKYIKIDKITHFLAAALIYDACMHFETHPIGALMIVLLAAVAKELIWDKLLKKGTDEFLDIIASLAGGVVMMIINHYIY